MGVGETDIRASRPLRGWRAPRLLAVVLLCCVGFPVLGADDALPAEPTPKPDEAGLESLLGESVVSTASRTAESESEAPATIWTISGTDLKRYGIQSIEEAIRFLGHAMTSYEYDSRLNAAFGARGYLSDNLGLHLAVLIDGNQAGGSAKTARGTQPYLMPIELVDHLEVVIGPGSVVYGNSAMLGVVNVVTRSAASLEGTHVVAQLSAGLPADEWAKDLSWGELWSRAAVYGGQRFDVGGEPFALAWHLGLRWDRQEGRSVWHPVSGADVFEDPLAAHTREDVFNRDLQARLFARATWGRWAFLSWVGFNRGTGTGPVNGSADSRFIEPEYGFDAAWSRHIGDRGSFALRAYAVVYDSRVSTVTYGGDEAHCLGAVGMDTCYDTVQYVSVKPFLEPVLTWDWKQDGTHVTTLGAQGFIDGSIITTSVTATDDSRSAVDEPILAPIPNGALYLQHIWRARFGTLNVGVRGDLGLLGSSLSPRFAYSTSLWTGGTLKFATSTGFRTPTITERYLEIEDFLTSNPDIQPERVHSLEVDLGQRFGLQRLQASFFFTYWSDLITTRGVPINGRSITQFANQRNVWSAGVNFGWQGAHGPFDWGLSLNYAPGRRAMPKGILGYSDQELADIRVRREALDQFGWSALGTVFLPADGMPDFYAPAHVSWSLGENLPRLSVAVSVSSPRMRAGYANDDTMLDLRNVDGPRLPWSVDVRGAAELQVGERVGLRLTVSGRSLPTVANPPRVGDTTGPDPRGGLGVVSSPSAPISAMCEVSLRL